MQKLTITRREQLRRGDLIQSWDGNPYKPPRIVVNELALITPGSPVVGVRLLNPRDESELEYVLYPVTDEWTAT